ncbi:MAG: undecaprenyldiphospho-muramoylpentapeptide beta-N-acetylglucosaminyltransferase [Gammaproteobacteria bacterium]|nr:undecaprenyldiphospho-muramoylpentapeptide beta-N-acetylglucosaminyltransferase [Gammaproteobacteria bacterium]
MAGGTGGHIYPALAVAAYLRQNDVALAWLGSGRGMENRIVPMHGIEIAKITITGLRGRGWLAHVLSPLTILVATIQAIIAIYRIQPCVVLGMGGFVSGPGGLAAWLCRKPLIIHEQNAIAGLTNRLLSRIANAVLAGYPSSFASICPARFTGNPVRAAIADLPTPGVRPQQHQALRLLIVGGSLGAHSLNTRVPSVLGIVANNHVLEVWHQCGTRDVATTEAAYIGANLTARVDSFIEDMAAAYVWADIVICRAGAITVAELAAAGVASILVPFPYAADDHQSANAQYLADRQAAIVVSDRDLATDKLYTVLESLANERSRILAMACRARNCAKGDAAATVGNVCLEFLRA